LGGERLLILSAVGGGRHDIEGASMTDGQPASLGLPRGGVLEGQGRIGAMQRGHGSKDVHVHSPSEVAGLLPEQDGRGRLASTQAKLRQQNVGEQLLFTPDATRGALREL